jgi:IclR family transcriptional regulator, acetate operon repressor
VASFVPPRETQDAAGTEASKRVADVLLLFASEPRQLGVTEVARQLGLSKAVVHRIMRSLESRQLVLADTDKRTYVLGPAAAAIGVRALKDVDLHSVALPVLRKLQFDTEETTTLSALVGTARVYLDQVVSLKEIKMTVEIGRPFPLHAGASSKAVLAFASPELRSHVLEHDLQRSLTARTIVGREKLERELDRIGDEGVATSLGERQAGAGSVASPIFDANGRVVGAISVCGPVDRFDASTVERFKPLVHAAARRISAELNMGNIESDGMQEPRK